MGLLAGDLDAGVPTIAEVLELIKSDRGLSENRKCLLRTAILALIKHTRVDPNRTKASYSACRGVLTRFEPASADLSQKWWRQVRTRLASAFVRYGGANYYTKGERLCRAWQDLKDRLPDRQFVQRLSRFIRYCNHLGIAPGQVSDQVSSNFRFYVLDGTSMSYPLKIHRQACIDWNRAVATVPDWPQIRLSVPMLRQKFSLPLTDFPPSFAADIRAWSERAASTNPLAKSAPPRPLRPETIYSQARQLRFFASALVHSGVPPRRIRGIADVVEPRNFRRGIKFMWERAGRKPTPNQHHIATNLRTIAKIWVGLDPASLEEMRRIAGRLRRPTNGLSERTRTVLRQLDDPLNVQKFLRLPKLLEASADKCPRVRKAAFLMQMSVAVDLLLVAPMRRSNLHALSLTENFIFTRRGRREMAHLVVPPAHVKNSMPIEFELPKDTIRRLNKYVKKHLPHLTSGAPDALFPGPSGRPKNTSALANQIVGNVKRFSGLRINVHAYRHIAARLFLEKFPHQYLPLALLLGHKTVQTTMRSYCELDARPVAREYAEDVLGREFERPAHRRRGERRPTDLGTLLSSAPTARRRTHTVASANMALARSLRVR